jgi:hypothetical protein
MFGNEPHIEILLLKEVNTARARLYSTPENGRAAPDNEAVELLKALERFTGFIFEGKVPPGIRE